jgi:hypothetical protein
MEFSGGTGLEVVSGTGFIANTVYGRILALKPTDSAPSDGEADSLWVWNSGLNRNFSTPAIGLVEGGNDTLMVVCTALDRIVMLRGTDGLLVKEVILPTGARSQHIANNGGNPTPPALADIDGDEDLEVVVGAERDTTSGTYPSYPDRTVRFYVWDPMDESLAVLQNSIPVSPLAVNSVLNGSVVGDLDGDGKMEIAFGTASAGLFVWEYDNGTYKPERGWPAILNGEVSGHLAIGNVDTTDVGLELLAVDRSGRVHMFDLGNIGTPTVEWWQLGNGPEHRGLYVPGSPPRSPETRPGTALIGGVPNPFNPITYLGFTVDRGGEVRIVIYDPTGRHVRSLFEGEVSPGLYDVTWDGRDSHGVRVGSGVYFVRLEAPGAVRTQKLVLLK